MNSLQWGLLTVCYVNGILIATLIYRIFEFLKKNKYFDRFFFINCGLILITSLGSNTKHVKYANLFSVVGLTVTLACFWLMEQERNLNK